MTDQVAWLEIATQCRETVKVWWDIYDSVIANFSRSVPVKNY